MYFSRKTRLPPRQDCTVTVVENNRSSQSFFIQSKGRYFHDRVWSALTRKKGPFEHEITQPESGQSAVGHHPMANQEATLSLIITVACHKLFWRNQCYHRGHEWFGFRRLTGTCMVWPPWCMEDSETATGII